MSNYPIKNRTILVKVESSAGTDASPTVGSNAVLGESPTFANEFRRVTTNESSGSLDSRPDIFAGGNRTFSMKVYLKGSGTSGTAPEFGPLLRGCGFSETTLVADVTGTAQGGAATTITLAASGTSSTNDFYVGHVIQITSGTGSSNTGRIITAYNGTTKVATVSPGWTSIGSQVAPDNTSVYAIRKCNLYKPTSSSIPYLTIYDYSHRNDGANSRLKKMTGAQGTAKLTLGAQGNFFDFSLKGSVAADSDVSHPGAATFQTTRPPPLLAGQFYLGNNPAKFTSLDIDLAANVAVLDDPNATYGVGLAGISARKITGNIVLPRELLSNRDTLSAIINGTEFGLTGFWGSTSGNRVAIHIPNMVFTDVSEQDVQGFGYEGIPFQINEEDTSPIVTFW